MRIGIQPGQHGDEVLRIQLRQRADRRRANRRARVAEHVEQQIDDAVALDAADGGHRLEAQRRVGLHGGDELEERRGARRVADPAEGTNRFDRQRAIGSFDERRQQRDGRAILHHAEALDGKGPRIRMGILHERQQRGQGTGILEALQRERDRPPAHARLRAIEHGGRQLVVSVQTDQREHRQPQCPNRRIADRVAVGARRLGHRSGLNDRRGHLADRIRRGSIADQPKRLGRAALHERGGITQRGNQRIARGRIADQTEAERRHLPHFRVRIGEELRERRHAFR